MSQTEDTTAIVKGFLRSIAQCEPTFAALAHAWSEMETHEQQKRISKFLIMLSRDMLRVKEKIILIEKKLITAKDFPFLIERVVDKVRRESSEHKVMLYAQLLANSMAADDSLSHEDKLNFIESLDTLTEHDIKILYYFNESSHLRLSLLMDEFPFHRHPVDSKDARDARDRLSHVIIAISKLEARGIISQSYASGIDVHDSQGDPEHWINRWYYRYYQVLPNGEKFIRVLKRCPT